MKHFALKKGLDIPITGSPTPHIENAPSVNTYGVLGDDYIGLKPRVLVEEGAIVASGTPLMVNKDQPEAQIVSPVSGRVKAVNRGQRRKLVSIVIEADDSAAKPIDFSKVGDASTAQGLTERLCEAGLWTSFRTRPYSKVPAPNSKPIAIYVTAMDSEPLSADPSAIIAEEASAFKEGLKAISLLCDGPTYLCQEFGVEVPGSELDEVEAVAFSGPHPSGLAGTHIHFLTSPRGEEAVWTISYQDVIVIGRLLQTGYYDPSCIISLAGPVCANPRLIRTKTGACLADLVQNDLPADLPVRMISGSVLSGKAGEGADGYLSRYARQITLIEEDKKQIPLGWIRPMASKYAVQPVLGSLFSKAKFPLSSNLNGGRRAMVPLGTFETLMPQDYLPTQLLRALLVMDTDQAQALGALELDEEDLGLVGFACPAKYEYGLALRDSLAKIEKEG